MAKINPKAVKKFTVKPGKKKQTLALSWKKAGGITGYEVQYSLKKNFKAKDKSTKTIRIKKAKTAKTTIKDLKLKKTYYVRIRAYKVKNGKTYYSAWSKAKKIKIKVKAK